MKRRGRMKWPMWERGGGRAAFLLAVFFTTIAALAALFFLAQARLLPEQGAASGAARLAEALHLAPTCGLPKYYRISAIDPRFGVGEKTVAAAAATAAAAWNRAAGKTVLAEKAGGTLPITLAYDERQRETDILQNLGIVISKGETAYAAVKKTYDSLDGEYAAAGAEYERAGGAFEQAQSAYNAKVDYWNSRGGAPPSEYDALNAERQALSNEYASLTEKKNALEAVGAKLGEAANLLNQTASNLNGTIRQYNESGQVVRGEFEAGLYQSDENGERITIYQFDSAERLAAILTHEFGHALGLGHNPDPRSIMYAESQGPGQTILPSDLAALKKSCPELARP